MSSAQYRPGIRNGRVRSRTENRAATRTDAQVESTKSRVGIAGRSGLMVLTTIIVAGLVVGVGFVLALQTQQQIHRIGIDEARLKAQFHEISNRQRVETLEQQRAFNQAEQMALVQPGGGSAPAGFDKFGAGMAPLEVFPAATGGRGETVGAPRPGGVPEGRPEERPGEREVRRDLNGGGVVRSIRRGDGDPRPTGRPRAGAGKRAGATVEKRGPERHRQAVVRAASKAAPPARSAPRKTGAGRSRVSSQAVRVAARETQRRSESGRGGRAVTREGR
jgi:hypothetical protein